MSIWDKIATYLTKAVETTGIIVLTAVLAFIIGGLMFTATGTSRY